MKAQVSLDDGGDPRNYLKVLLLLYGSSIYQLFLAWRIQRYGKICHNIEESLLWYAVNGENTCSGITAPLCNLCIVQLASFKISIGAWWVSPDEFWQNGWRTHCEECRPACLKKGKRKEAHKVIHCTNNEGPVRINNKKDHRFESIKKKSSDRSSGTRLTITDCP